MKVFEGRLVVAIWSRRPCCETDVVMFPAEQREEVNVLGKAASDAGVWPLLALLDGC